MTIWTFSPSGRLMFQIIGAMAEFERSLIQERVRAGLRNAKLKGKTLGKPRRVVSGDQMARLRERGVVWSDILIPDCTNFSQHGRIDNPFSERID